MTALHHHTRRDRHMLREDGRGYSPRLHHVVCVHHQFHFDDADKLPVPIARPFVDVIREHQVSIPDVIATVQPVRKVNRRGRMFDRGRHDRHHSSHLRLPVAPGRACAAHLPPYDRLKTLTHRMSFSSCGIFSGCDIVALDAASDYRAAKTAYTASANDSTTITATTTLNTRHSRAYGSSSFIAAPRRTERERQVLHEAHEPDAPVSATEGAAAEFQNQFCNAWGRSTCVQYRLRRLSNIEKSSARLCRAMHDCAVLYSAGCANRLGRSKQPRNWQQSSAAQFAPPLMKSLASVSRQPNQSTRSIPRSWMTTNAIVGDT